VRLLKSQLEKMIKNFYKTKEEAVWINLFQNGFFLGRKGES
jgi:hypothetical protein